MVLRFRFKWVRKVRMSPPRGGEASAGPISHLAGRPLETISCSMSDAPRYSFPIARRLLRFASRARGNWLSRHRNGFNFAIHMVGIPLSLIVAPVLWFLAPWAWGLAAFLGGYLLQWIGHRVEGNDVGEFIPIKRLLGLPVVAIAPPFQPPASPSSAP